jgi:hypothetical protein
VGLAAPQARDEAWRWYAARYRYRRRYMLTRSSAVITDPDDSRFDLEKFLQYVAGEKA